MSRRLEALVGDALAVAHASHPADWVDDDAFVREALARADDPLALPRLHLADLYLVCACVRGHPKALALLDAHVVAAADHAARRDASFGAEIAQALRERLLVPKDGAARLAQYGARGPLGAWLRMAAVRVAQNLRRGAPRPGEALDERIAQDADPEMLHLKRRYGDVVSRALRAALADLGPDDRTVLMLHYVDGLTIEQVGAAQRVSRATAARMLSRARDAALRAVEAKLRADLGLGETEVKSLVDFARSHLRVSLAR